MPILTRMLHQIVRARTELRNEPRRRLQGKQQRLVGGRGLHHYGDIVEPIFTFTAVRNFFCTSLAALMELILDAPSRLRDIADSSEIFGVRAACERQ